MLEQISAFTFSLYLQLDAMKHTGQSAVRLVLPEPSAPTDAGAEERDIQMWLEKALLGDSVASATSLDSWLSAQEQGARDPVSEPTPPLQ
jgi:hypothetical protein